ncbi:MAG: transglutaminase domain-containing protein [Planctomycetaceae bacterium]|nr:transglutaminase domain-containing protein [Planctomycetaceae bacterium]
MRRFILTPLLLVLLAGATATVAAGEHPWNNKRIHYVIEHLGRLVEKGEFVRRVGSYMKKPCWVIEENKFFYDGVNPDPVRGVRTRTLTTLDGLALQRTESAIGASDGEEFITIIAGQAQFRASGVYGQSGSVPVPADVLFEIGGEWLASRRQRAGSVYTASVLDRMTRGVVVTEVRIREMVDYRYVDRNRLDFWEADISTPGRPDVTARYTTDGRLLRLEGGGMVYSVVGREDYIAGRIPVPAAGTETADAVAVTDGEPLPADGAGAPVPDGAIRRSQSGNAVIPIGESVPAWDSFAWLLFRAGPPYEWTSALQSSTYSHIEYNGAEATIMAIQNAPIVDSEAVFPMAIPAEIQPYLGSSEFIPSAHPAIIDAAWLASSDAETKREETNVLRAVSYIAGWINQNIDVVPWQGYESSALDTLNRRSGDSLGQARLFSAMAQTLGVPSRLCQGFIAHIGQAVNHCWAEAWINGRWIPVDTTVSRVGLPAGYVLAARAQGSGAIIFNFADFMRTPGLGLTLVAAGRDTPRGGEATLRVGDRRSYAVTEGDWMANLYWGFALQLPRSWTGQARLNTVEITSGDRNASVKCEALEGDFRAGREELDATVESLRTSLDRFRAIENRVVDFDDDGATPALYIDFTCFQDGNTLRCRQYVIPRRQRAFRISFWAPADRFGAYTREFDRILASFEF